MTDDPVELLKNRCVATCARTRLVLRGPWLKCHPGGRGETRFVRSISFRRLEKRSRKAERRRKIFPCRPKGKSNPRTVIRRRCVVKMFLFLLFRGTRTVVFIYNNVTTPFPPRGSTVRPRNAAHSSPRTLSVETPLAPEEKSSSHRHHDKRQSFVGSYRYARSLPFPGNPCFGLGKNDPYRGGRAPFSRAKVPPPLPVSDTPMPRAFSTGKTLFTRGKSIRSTANGRWPCTVYSPAIISAAKINVVIILIIIVFVSTQSRPTQILARRYARASFAGSTRRSITILSRVGVR
uniref:Uncharacterized protein n=1 Tax=Sipha flava TaxID=143950 RepID=A0A2S2QNQ9_9HEMI